MPPPEITDALTELERLDMAADQAIAACGGDMRSTIRALILANEISEYEMRINVSAGFMRGVRHGRFNTYPGQAIDRSRRLEQNKNMSIEPSRKFPPPWKAGVRMSDGNGVPIDQVFHRDESRRFGYGGSKLTKDEARNVGEL